MCGIAEGGSDVPSASERPGRRHSGVTPGSPSPSIACVGSCTVARTRVPPRLYKQQRFGCAAVRGDAGKRDGRAGYNHTMALRAVATDYDGTLATNGAVDAVTVAALRRFRAADGKLLLVTGRQ